MKLRMMCALALLFLVGCSQKVSENVRTTKMNRLDALIIYYSQTEGAVSYDAASLLYSELRENPLGWYVSMAKDTNSYNRFLRDIDNRIFVEHGQLTIQDLENSRKQILMRLRGVEIPTEYEELHHRLIQKLEFVKPRKIL